MRLTRGDRCSIRASSHPDISLIYMDNMTFVLQTQITRLKMAKQHDQVASVRTGSGLETVATSEEMNADSQVVDFSSWRTRSLMSLWSGGVGEGATRERQEPLYVWGSASVLKVGSGRPA